MIDALHISSPSDDDMMIDYKTTPPRIVNNKMANERSPSIVNAKNSKLFNYSILDVKDDIDEVC